MKFHCLITLLISSMILSCEESPTDTAHSLNENKVVIDQEQFDIDWSAIQSSSITSDMFQMHRLYQEGTSILVDVSYGGGCNQHSFELIWPEVTALIYPPRYTVILKHSANGDLCEAHLSESIRFDLSKYDLGLTADVIAIMDLTIINGSNPDEVLKLNN